MISDAQFAFWTKRDADRVVLFQQDYMTEDGGEPLLATFYASDKGYTDHANGIVYPDSINAVPNFSRQLSGERLGQYQSSVGTVEFDNADGDAEVLLDYPLDGSEGRFYLGDRSWAFADFRLLFATVAVKASAPAIDRVSLQIKDTGFVLDKSIGGSTVVGGSGPNADRARSLNFGFLHQVECLVSDEPTLTYVHSDTGDATFAATVRDRGVDVTATTTENGDGTITLGVSPSGNITADVLSVLPGSDPGDYSQRKLSDAFYQLIGVRGGLVDAGRYYGPGPTFNVGDIDDYLIGISLPEATNLQGGLLPQLVDSGNCFWAILRGGQFTFGRLRPDDIESFGLTAVEIADDDIDHKSIKVEHATPTYFLYQAYMNKNWSIQSNLADVLTADEFAQFQRKGLYLVQDSAIGDTYADAPEKYDLSMVESPPIETLLSGGFDEDDIPILQAWMETRRFMLLPWLEIVYATVGISFYGLELGDPVRLTLADADNRIRFGCDGVLTQVILTNIRPTDAKVDLALIRRKRAIPYPEGWARATTDVEPDASYLITDTATPPIVIKPPGGDGSISVPGAPFYPGNIGLWAFNIFEGTAPICFVVDTFIASLPMTTDFFASWRVTAGADGGSAATAESNLRTAHGNAYNDGTAAGSAWVKLPLAVGGQVLFQFSSVGEITTHSNPTFRKVYTREANIGVTTESLGYVFDNTNLITSEGLPTGIADNSTAQIVYTFRIDCVSDVLSFKCDAGPGFVPLSSSSPFLSGTIADLTLTSSIDTLPSFVLYNGTPSDVQTWPVDVPTFETNWTGVVSSALADHIGEVGATWSLDGWFDSGTELTDLRVSYGSHGQVTIRNNLDGYERAALASGVPPDDPLAAGFPVYNYSVEMVIEAQVAPNEEHVGMIARATADGQWFYALMVYPNMADLSMHIDLLAVSDFNATTTTVYTGTQLTAGLHTIRWELSEENHKVKVDGTTLATFVSTASAEAGLVGFVTDNTIDAVALDPVSIPIVSFRACTLPFTGRNYFVRDEFIGTADTQLTSHTGETGATWTTAPAYDSAIAAPALDGNGNAYVTPDAFGGSNFGVVASGTPPSADYFVEARTFLASGGTGTLSAILLLARVVDANNLYAVRMEPGIGGRVDIQINKVVAGTLTNAIASYNDGGTNTAFRTHTLRFALTGTILEVYLDGELVIYLVDADVSGAGVTGLVIVEGGGSKPTYAVQRFLASDGSYGPPPVNDDFAHAQVIAGVVSGPTTLTAVDNTYATSQSGETLPSGNPNASRSLWWKVTPASNLTLDCDTLQSTTVLTGVTDTDTDTVLTVYTGASVNALTEIATNDDWLGTPPPDYVSQLTGVALTSGTTYYIAVHTYNATVPPLNIILRYQLS